LPSSLDGKTERQLTDLANAAGQAVGGAWSVDVLETRRGWYVTDMAEAASSCHEWPDCPNTFRPLAVAAGLFHHGLIADKQAELKKIEVELGRWLSRQPRED
jgi:hypothetical protein